MSARTTPPSLLAAYNPNNYRQKPRLTTRWETETRYQFGGTVNESPHDMPMEAPSPLPPEPVRADPTSIFAPMSTTIRPRSGRSPSPQVVARRSPSPPGTVAASTTIGAHADPPHLSTRRGFQTTPELEPSESRGCTPKLRSATPSRAPFCCYRVDSLNRHASTTGSLKQGLSRTSSPTASRNSSPHRRSSRCPSPAIARPPSPSLQDSITRSMAQAGWLHEPPMSAYAYIPMPPPAASAQAPRAAPRPAGGVKAAYTGGPPVGSSRVQPPKVDIALQAGSDLSFSSTEDRPSYRRTTSPRAMRREAGTQMSPRNSPTRPRTPAAGTSADPSTPNTHPCPLHHCPQCHTALDGMAPLILGAIPVLWGATGPHHLHTQSPCPGEQEQGTSAPPAGAQEKTPLPRELQQLSHVDRRNPKNYRGLPVKYMNLIESAGQPSVPARFRSSTVSECFHMFD